MAECNNYVRINYYSNYADRVRYSIDDSPLTVQDLDATKNVLLLSQDYYCNTYYNDLARDYSGFNSNDTLIMRRRGYIPTRYWYSDNGVKVHEEYNRFTGYGYDIAELFGVDIYAGNVEINLYAEWIPQTEIYITNDGYIYASDFIVDDTIHLDGVNIHAKSFTVADDNNIKVNSDGIIARGFRYGHPHYEYASTLLGDYEP